MQRRRMWWTESEKEKNQKKMGRVMERIQGIEEVAG